MIESNISSFAFLIAVLAIGACLLDWRAGVFITIGVGFLQDVVRKLMPGQPIYLTVLIGVFIAASCVGAYGSGARFNFRAIHAWNGILRKPLQFFTILVCVQSLVTFAKTFSPVLTGIGLLTYLAPMPAILLGYHFCRNERDILRLVKVYLFFSTVMVSGIYLSYLGYNWRVLQPVAEGLIAFSPSGQRLVLLSGFLRTSEIAAWHCGASICLVLVLSLAGRSREAFQWPAGLLILFFTGALLFTGRRKFLMEIFIFISIYAVLLVWFRRGAMKLALAVMVSATVASVAVAYFVPDEFNTRIASYYERSATVQNEAKDRMISSTLGSFRYVLLGNGIFGAGAGIGSQGAQYFGGGTSSGLIAGTAAEGGLGKVLAELGLPGLTLLLWLAVSLVRYIIPILSSVKSVDVLQARLTYGLLAFLVANAFVYSIAHQVFGDFFVLFILGLFLGFILAVPKMLRLSAPHTHQRGPLRLQRGIGRPTLTRAEG